MTGNPIPKTSWVINGRIVNNNTSPGMPFSDQRWLLFEETYAIHKWYNLTVTNAGYENQGEDVKTFIRFNLNLNLKIYQDPKTVWKKRIRRVI